MGIVLIVRSGDEIRLVAPSVIIQTVDTLLVAFQGEVGHRRSKVPDLFFYIPQKLRQDGRRGEEGEERGAVP